MDEMRVLTVRQPWAWAIFNGGKDVENRKQNIAGSFRGRVAVHVGLAYAEIDRLTPTDELDAVQADWFEEHDPGMQSPEFWPWLKQGGTIIGVVNLTDAHRDNPECSCSTDRNPWAQRAAWHLRITNAELLPEPIPYTGALGLCRLDTYTQQQIERALAEGEPA